VRSRRATVWGKLLGALKPVTDPPVVCRNSPETPRRKRVRRETLGLLHPGLEGRPPKTLRDRRYVSPEVFFYVPTGDVPHGDFSSVGVTD
jgi:hypothetical protein